MNGCGCGKPMCKPSRTAAMSMTRCRVPVTETQRHDTQAEIHVCMEKGTPGRHAHNNLARAAAGTPVGDVAQINNILRLAQSRNRCLPGNVHTFAGASQQSKRCPEDCSGGLAVGYWYAVTKRLHPSF